MKITRCQLILIPGLRSPATCGIWRSRVLLPAELVSQLSPRQLSTIIRHELTHVRQHDYLWDRLAALGCRLVFFHPAVWLAYRRIRWDRELACDQMVVKNGRSRRLQYAECLTQLARWSYFSSRTFPDGIGFSSASSLLATRVATLLRDPRPQSGLRRAAGIVFIIFLAAVGICSLPSLGLTLHLPEVVRSRQKVDPTVRLRDLRRKWVSAPTQRSLNPNIRALSDPKNVSKPYADFVAYIPPVLPVLENAASREASAKDVAGDNNNRRLTDSRGSWDESQSPMPGAHAPDWRKLVLHAAIAGIGATTGHDSDDKRPDRD